MDEHKEILDKVTQKFADARGKKRLEKELQDIHKNITKLTRRIEDLENRNR